MRTLGLAGALTLIAGAAFADEAPYIGVWDCGVGVFTFTAQTYNPGGDMLVIESIEMDGTAFILSFADGYQIGLSNVGDDTMGWLSMESGDQFDCTRLYF